MHMRDYANVYATATRTWYIVNLVRVTMKQLYKFIHVHERNGLLSHIHYNAR